MLTVYALLQNLRTTCTIQDGRGAYRSILKGDRQIIFTFGRLICAELTVFAL